MYAYAASLTLSSAAARRSAASADASSPLLPLDIASPTPLNTVLKIAAETATAPKILISPRSTGEAAKTVFIKIPIPPTKEPIAPPRATIAGATAKDALCILINCSLAASASLTKFPTLNRSATPFPALRANPLEKLFPTESPESAPMPSSPLSCLFTSSLKPVVMALTIISALPTTAISHHLLEYYFSSGESSKSPKGFTRFTLGSIAGT